MPDDDVDLPFQTYTRFVAARFGRPLHRVALDAGSTCPNRDGTKGRGGCTYCDVEGSGTGALQSGAELDVQLRLGLARVARRGASRGIEVGAIAYFQSYSNTYVSIERLEEVLAVVEPFLAGSASPGLPPVMAISVATRPDTLPEASLDVLARWNERVPVWLEIGLETADDALQRALQRNHTRADFEDATRRARARGLLVVGHAILGLPGDGRAGARRTAEVLAACDVEGVKVHQLMILRRTQLEKPWRAGSLATLDRETYVAWLADFVERLRPNQVLHRITGDAAPAQLLAPDWSRPMNGVRALLSEELVRRGTRQGSRASKSDGTATPFKAT